VRRAGRQLRVVDGHRGNSAPPISSQPEPCYTAMTDQKGIREGLHRLLNITNGYMNSLIFFNCILIVCECLCIKSVFMQGLFKFPLLLLLPVAFCARTGGWDVCHQHMPHTERAGSACGRVARGYSQPLRYSLANKNEV
jgi:hypothetical protein